MKYNYKPKGYYDGARYDILNKVDFTNVKRVLDIGCGKGNTLKVIKDKYQNIEIWGVEYMEEYGKIAKNITGNILIGSIEENLKNLPNNYFDTIFMLDVIEHITYPEDVLKELKNKLIKRGIIYTSLPNVSHIKVIYNLIFKRDWKYEDSGIMDYTHMRFFTPKSIRRMFEKLGYEIIDQKGITPSSWWKHLPFTLLSLGYLYKNRFIQIYTKVQKVD